MPTTHLTRDMDRTQAHIPNRRGSEQRQFRSTGSPSDPHCIRFMVRLVSASCPPQSASLTSNPRGSGASDWRDCVTELYFVYS